MYTGPYTCGTLEFVRLFWKSSTSRCFGSRSHSVSPEISEAQFRRDELLCSIFCTYKYAPVVHKCDTNTHAMLTHLSYVHTCYTKTPDIHTHLSRVHTCHMFTHTIRTYLSYIHTWQRSHLPCTPNRYPCMTTNNDANEL